MSPYETLIDPTNFGTVARYLHDPQSPIQYVLHVKEESMLAGVAAKLDAAMAASQGKPVAVRSILDPMLQDGSLRLSARHELQVKDASHLVAASSIPNMAFCRVIYLPPFYLAHTPGLFEGTLVQPEPRLRHGPGHRMKL
jgi:hypothetical protein